MAATTPEWIIAFDAKRFTERKREKEKKEEEKGIESSTRKRDSEMVHKSIPISS